MTEFYRLKGKIYHNGIYLYTADFESYFGAEQRPDETVELTWDNVSEYYSKFPGWGFGIYHFKRGRVISFNDWSLKKHFKHKEWRDIWERKSPLNMTVEFYSVKLIKSIDSVMQWLNAEEVIQYLTERGLSLK